MAKTYKTKRKNRIHYGSWAFDIILVIFMAAVSIVFIYPFLNVLSVSLSSNRMISTGQVTFFPRELMVEGYKMLFEEQNIWRAYLNTVIIAVGATLVNLVCTSMLAYAMMMPDAVSAYNVFVYRSFYKGISPEIREAARIDGASDIKILTKIYVPLSKALYATFGLFSIVGVWNSYYEALLYIKNPDMQPIQMILRKIVFATGLSSMSNAQQMIGNGVMNKLNVQYACVVATVAPVLIIYPFLQKYFAQGMQVGAVKG